MSTTTGIVYCGAGTGVLWSNPSYITANDANYAKNPVWQSIIGSVDTNYLTADSFGFSTGPGDSIDGIEVHVGVGIEGYPTYNGTYVCVLGRGGAQVGSSGSFAMNGGSDNVIGSSSDTWGAGFDGSNIGQLQVIMHAYGTTGAGYPYAVENCVVNYVYAKITYTDRTPNAFTFTDITGAARSTLYTSNSIAVSGLESAGITSAISISGTGAQYEKNGSGTWVSTPGTVVNGDTVKVRLTSSASFSTAKNAVLTIGGISDTYTVTTETADTTPNAFSFVDVSGIELSTLTASAGVTITGINTGSTITVSGAGGKYNINGGAFTASSGTVQPNDLVCAQNTSSGSPSTNVDTTVTIGGVSDIFTITSRAPDTTPNAISFTPVTGAALSTQFTSNTITVTGVEAAVNLTFSTSGGTTHEYSINGGAWTAVGNTTINNGDQLAVRMISPAAPGQAGNNTVTIGTAGTVSSTFSVITTADTTPNAFSFTSQLTALPGAMATSNGAVIGGMDPAVPIGVSVDRSDAQLQVNASGWVSSSTIQNGDTLTVRVAAPLRPGDTKVVTANIFGVTGTFTVTTRNVWNIYG